MSKYLLDADILTLAQYNHPKVQQEIARHSPQEIAISTVTVRERINGWFGLLDRARTPAALENAHAFFILQILPVLRLFDVIPMTIGAIQRFDQLVAGHGNVGKNDLRIAATALENGLIVATRNRRDFGQVKGLVIEDWSV